jgi:hypothetical protein
VVDDAVALLVVEVEEEQIKHSPFVAACQWMKESDDMKRGGRK